MTQLYQRDFEQTSIVLLYKVYKQYLKTSTIRFRTTFMERTVYVC